MERAEPGEQGLRLVIRPGPWDYRPSLGDSVCVSGCCLTVADAGDGSLGFTAIPETLSKTTLGGWRPGTRVNLERSLRASDLMGGHVVQGHVDGIGVIERVERAGEFRVSVRPPVELVPYLVPKGSVTVDGVSLTVAALDAVGGTFDVALIPVTREATTLGAADPGARVNLEMDVMAKTIVHYLRHFAPAAIPGAH